MKFKIDMIGQKVKVKATGVTGVIIDHCRTDDESALIRWESDENWFKFYKLDQVEFVLSNLGTKIIEKLYNSMVKEEQSFLTSAILLKLAAVLNTYSEAFHTARDLISDHGNWKHYNNVKKIQEIENI